VEKRGRRPTVLPEQAVVLEDIKNTAHLREDEDTGTLRLHRLEKFVENQHLAGRFNKVLVRGEGRSGLGAVEEVGVVAAFL
jgi:hypothetical protein